VTATIYITRESPSGSRLELADSEQPIVVGWDDGSISITCDTPTHYYYTIYLNAEALDLIEAERGAAP
jgi:hypothetical protein